MGVRFPALILTSPWVHLDSHTVGTGSFPVVQWHNHTLLPSTEAKERVELYFTPPLCLHGRLQCELYFLCSSIPNVYLGVLINFVHPNHLICHLISSSVVPANLIFRFHPYLYDMVHIEPKENKPDTK